MKNKSKKKREGNIFRPLPELPSQDAFRQLVANFQYKRINVDEVPWQICSTGLTEKFNSVIVCASGGTNAMLYTIVGIRPDGLNLDEHPIVYYYDQHNSTSNFCGIIDHGNWNGRTTPFEASQLQAMASSGLTAGFNYKGIPMNASGSLEDLRANGMLEGISEQFQILFKSQAKFNAHK